MKSSTATTIAEYFKTLSPDRRAALSTVRAVIRKHLPKGYEEGFHRGMITYTVPLSVLAETYNGHPLWYVALAAQKNYNSLYLMNVYGSKELLARFKQGFAAAGKKLDMGKSCIHFKTADDLPLDVIGATVAAVPMTKWIEIYQSSRKGRTP